VAAAPDPLTRGVTVWSSTQAPHNNRNSLAQALGLSHGQVRVIAPEVGGGFGAKIGAYPGRHHPGCAGPAPAPTGQVVRDALRAFHGDEPGARAGRLLRTSRNEGGAHPRLAGQSDPGSRGLPQAPAPGRTDCHDVRRGLRYSQSLDRDLQRAHQHHTGRCLPRRWSTRGGLLHRTDDGPLGPQARQGSR
jgi:hypothetical protein